MINVSNLTKSYIYNGKKITVFKDLNFSIPSGKSVALLGRNGAGKSTLLRLLGGIDYPDSGKISSSRSISWPVGLEGGFQGSLTGRENVVFVSKLYCGNNKKLIREKVLIVKNFSEIGEYFDRPYKTYSNGMKSRVTFGLSMAFKFNVYLIDEVTGAGDERFRRKCKNVLSNLHRTSDFIMVNHNLYGLQFHCDSALVLHNGRLLEFESLKEGIKVHKELLNSP